MGLSFPIFGSAYPGIVPASGGGTSNFLRADGSFAAPSGGGGISKFCDLGTTGATGLNYTTPAVITGWDTEIRDTDGFWSIGDPSKLIIPAGISTVFTYYNIRFNAVNNNVSLRSEFLLNGNTIPGMSSYSGGDTSVSLNACNIIQVSENDYIQVQVVIETDTNVNLAAISKFGLMVVE